MARYQITLAYDGTHFLGFQRQGKGRTVQAEVEKALLQLNWLGKSILAAGRTDSGVHAAGQVIAFDLDWPHPTDVLGRALNAHLPKDVAVKAVQVAADDFHPRFDARVRSYQYNLYCAPGRDPLLERYAWRIWPPVEIEKLQSASSLFQGVHDFSAFGTPPRPGGSTTRVVYYVGWKLRSEGLLFEVSANAFLYHMVRRMVFLQVSVGQNRLSLEELASGVCSSKPQPPGLAPAQGLILSGVRYELLEQENQVLKNAEGLPELYTASGEDDFGKDLRH